MPKPPKVLYDVSIPHIPDDEHSVSLKEAKHIAKELKLSLTKPNIVSKFLMNNRFYYCNFLDRSSVFGWASGKYGWIPLNKSSTAPLLKEKKNDTK